MNLPFNEKEIKNDSNLVWHAIKLFNEVDRVTLPVIIMQCLLTVIRPYILIFLSSYLINALYEKTPASKIIQTAWIVLLIHLLLGVFEHYLGKVKWTKFRNMKAFQELMMDKKILTMDYGYLESEEIQKLIRHQADYAAGTDGVYFGLFYNLDIVLQKALTVICSIVIVVPLFFKKGHVTTPLEVFIGSPYFSALIIGCISVGIICSIRSSNKLQKKVKSVQDEMLYLNRRFNYYFSHFLDGYDRGKDVRIFSLGSLIDRENDSMLENVNDCGNKIEKARWHFERMNQPIAAFNGGIVYLFVGLRALIGAITPGEIMKYAGSINQFIGAISEMMTAIIGIRVNNQYLREFVHFIDLKPIMQQSELPVEKRRDNKYHIECKHVSFKYPGSDVYVLKDLNLSFEIGGKMAVVGRNGSGKTTFIKLLCRLYEPTEGEILLNGININKYAYEEYLKLFSVVFQDSRIYAFPLGCNVAASEVYDPEKVEDALVRANLKAFRERMTNGLDTCLYKEFDDNGIEISGGESQRLTIARAIYQDRPFVIMDEPTAALDPIAEYRVYAGFNEMVNNKTAIYISHRLSSCRFCDEILVFDKGSVVQKGSHEVLLEKEGIYQKLWHAQAQYYADTEQSVVFQ